MLYYIISASSLTHIFNFFQLTPVTKVDTANYRPISVLSVIAKLFEKAIFNQVYKYESEN